MKYWIKRLTGLLFVAGAGVLLFYALRPQPTVADFETVARGPMRVTVDEEGETRLRNRYVVSAPVAGRILRIELEPGDPVIAGRTPIATFLPIEPGFLDARARTEAESRVQAAEAAIGGPRAVRDRLREELVFAESRFARDQELFEQGLIPRERFESTDFEVRSAREALKAAEFAVGDAEQAVEVARSSLVQITEETAAAGSGDPITIRSPISGVVLRRIRESEAVVPAGEQIVELGDMRQIEIVSDLLSEDAVQVRTGNTVLIEQWGGGMTLLGRVRLVEPSGITKLSALGVEEQRVNVIVDFDDVSQAGEYLGDGYRVVVRIVLWETDDTLIAPTSSLFRTGDDWTVFAVIDGIVELRTVEIGRRNGLDAQVLSGLAEGETVIVHPADDIAPGIEVVARGAD